MGLDIDATGDLRKGHLPGDSAAVNGIEHSHCLGYGSIGCLAAFAATSCQNKHHDGRTDPYA
jgi:hypothetical protein